jgi:hypothetical protein
MSAASTTLGVSDVAPPNTPRLDATRLDATRLDTPRLDTPRLDATRLDAVCKLLREAREPLPTSKIAAGMKSLGRCPAKQCEALAEALVQSGRAFRFPPASGKAFRYWAHDERAHARALIEQSLENGKRRSLADVDKIVAKKLPGLSRVQRDEVLAALERGGKVYRWPPAGRGAVRLAQDPPNPREYLRSAARAFRKQLAGVRDRLAAAGVAEAQILAAALEELGLTAPPAMGASAAPSVGIRAAPSAAGASLAAFSGAFDAAFARLDRQRGSHNFVNLVELRQALPEFPRAAFDEGLHRLRRDGKYGLSAAESIHGIRPEEQEAGIREAGALLLFVSRKQP